MLKSLLKKAVAETALVLSVFGLFFLAGCNVGLGENVDTAAPVIEVAYPPLAAVIRDRFVFSGKYFDDKGIVSVTVSVTDTATKKTVGTYFANFNPLSLTWQVTIDSKGYKDGNYQFSVTATDGAGHSSGAASRTFDIDNTPPVFIATKPGVKKADGKNASAYGSTLSVNGTIADDHAISKMDLTVYDKETLEPVKTFQAENISTAGGSSVLFADANKSTENVHRQNYDVLYDYDAAADSTQNFFASVRIEDAARVYLNPGEKVNNTKGNSTYSLYLYDDIYEDLMSAKNGLGLSANDFKNILNNTVPDHDGILEKLNAVVVDTTPSEEGNDNSGNYLSFSLNPNANPTYVVNGYELDFDNKAAVRSFSAGNSISVSIAAGLDGTQLLPYGRYEEGKTKLPSLKVWVKEYSSIESLEIGDAINDLSELQEHVKTLENSVTDADDEKAKFVPGTTTDSEDGKWMLVYDYMQDPSKSVGSSVDTETISVEISSALKVLNANKYYLVGVTGCDLDVNDFASNKKAFIFQDNEAKVGFSPYVNITTPKNSGIDSNESGYVFKGSAVMDEKYSELYVSKLVADFTYNVRDSRSIVPYQETVLIDEDQNVTGSKCLEFLVEDDEEDETGTRKKGYFEFNPAKDSGLMTKLSEALRGGKVVQYSLTVTATSSSGDNYKADATKYVYIDTVAPAFVNENSSVESNGNVQTGKVNVNKAWFNSKAPTFKGEFTDDGSGVSIIRYWLNPVDDRTVENAKTITTESENSPYKYSATISGFNEGVNTIYLSAYDAAGNSSAPEMYTVMVDTKYPSFSSRYYEMGDVKGNASGSVLTNKKNSIEIYGLISDQSSGVAEMSIPNAVIKYSTNKTKEERIVEGSETPVEVSLVDGDDFINWAKVGQTWKNYSDITDKTTITGWKATIPASKIDNGDVFATTQDIAGNSLEQRLFTFTVDEISPDVDYSDVSDADTDTDGVQVNGKIVLTGTASDNNQMSEIKDIQYKLGTNPWASLGKDPDSSAYKWYSPKIDTSDTPFAASKSGNLEVRFRAVALDKAGNTNEESEEGIKLILNQDTDRPVIKITSLDKSGDTISAQSIMGTVSDDDGIDKFEYSANAGTDWTEIPVSSGSWKIDGLDAGKYSLTFRVTDLAGTVFTTNASTTTYAKLTRPKLRFANYKAGTDDDNKTAVTFDVDLTAPEIKLMKLASTSNAAAPAEYSSSNVSFGEVSKYLWIYTEAVEDVAVNESALSDVTVKIGDIEVPLTAAQVKRTGSAGTENKLTYVVGPIDVTTLKDAESNTVVLEGTVTVTMTVRDKSGRSSSENFNVYVDGAAPELSITSPDATEVSKVLQTSDEITGKVEIKGKITDSSKISSFKYLIPTNAQITAGVTKSTAGWKDMESLVDEGENQVNFYKNRTSCSWIIPFTSSSFTASDGSSLIYYATVKTAGKLVYAEETTGSVYVPLYFYVQDSTGNEQIVKSRIFVNPEGGIPVLEIVTPDDFAKTGGNLNIQGTASDDEKVAKVVLEKLEFSVTDATEATIDSVTDWKTVTKAILSETDVVTKGTVQTDGTILAQGTLKSDGSVNYSSWKFAINTSKISTAKGGALATLLGTAKDAFGDDVAKDIKIARATITAYDENETANTFQISTLKNDGKAVKRNIFVDKNAPKLTNVQLVQFDGDASPAATPVIARAYSAGMYISNNTGNGKWYLKGTVTDDASVKGIYITTTGKGYIPLEGSVDTISSDGIITDTIDDKTVNFIIPIKTAAADIGTKTQFYPTIELDDGQHTDVTQNLSFYVDNKAPALNSYDEETGTVTSTTELNHKPTLKLTDNKGSIVGLENVIENSDGSYTFGDTISEDGSGLAYAVFYIKKLKAGASGSDRVYSPMYNNGANNNEVQLSATKAADKVYINSENLPALVKTVTRPSALEISYTGLGTNKNIRNGGLVKIGGSYHMISAINGNTVTLEDEVDVNYKEAEFIYAQVVNHQVTEGFDASSDTGVSNDDGDGMVEMVKQSGTSYKWSASILSDNVKDGPAEVHVVVFDAAGNANSGYVKTSIQNNRPRIAKVYLGTDLNGSGKFDYFSETAGGAVNTIDERDATVNGTEFGELSYYSALSADGKIQGNVTLKSSAFTAKNGLLVLPEIIGGNGGISYTYKAADTDQEAGLSYWNKDATASGTNMGSTLSAKADLNLADKAGTMQTVADLLASHDTADKYNYISSTAGEYSPTKHGGPVTGAYKGIILETSELEQYESWTKAGGRKIKYFAFTFWDSTEETTQGIDSLYALLKVPMAVNVIDDVAPSVVIKPFWWNSKDDSSFVYDDDGNAEGHIDIDDGTGKEHPGVSGEVYIDGKAEDETMLKELFLKAPDGVNKKVAEYTGGKWTKVTEDWPENWKDIIFTSTPEPNQSGHTVEFKVDIDMTTYGIGKNKTVDFAAGDKAGTESAASTAQTIDPKVKAGGKLTSHYIMDFVPYIKSIYPASESVANRSRLGRFPVQAGQDMYIEGMNFATGSTYTVKFYKTGASTAASSIANANVTKVRDGLIKVKAPLYSRYVEVVVDSVATKNNTNTNGGYNIEAGYVAKDADMGLGAANKAGTNFWTDDRYVSVWNVETNLSGSINPHSGVVKKVTAANSANGKLGTTAGALNTKESGDGVEPVTGLTDTYFAALSSDDLRIYTYDLGSKTGNDIANRYTFGTNQTDIFRVPADAVDCAIVNGVPYYVVQDNWVGNVDANCWGPGLFMARAGWKWNKTDLNSDGTPANTGNYNVIIEKQGNSGSARERDKQAGTGYDYVLYQFKNPRIAGWHKEAAELTYDANKSAYAPATDYIYISYYDSYARCLKFAAYRAGYRTHNSGKLDNVGGMWGSNTGRSDGDGGDLEVEVRMADDMTGGKAVVAGFDTLNFNPTQFVEEVGEWSDIMVDVTTENDPHPVIVYYNKTKRSLEVAYGKTAFPKMETGNVIAKDKAYNSATDNTETVWTKTKGITPDSKVDFGRYVSAAMDKDGNIHIAAQDATNVKLYYMFLKKNGETYTVDTTKTTVVDGIRGSGSWTDIELTNAAGDSPATCMPVISYINSSYLGTTQGSKVAYVVEVDETTGKPTFEAMTDPAKWKTLDQRTSVLPSVKEDKGSTGKATAAVGFNSSVLALDFLRGEQ